MPTSKTLSEWLDLSRETANFTRPHNSPGPSVDCKRSLTILPLRYGVVSGLHQATVEELAPTLPPHLGKKLTPALTHSRYAVRSIREGYVYVFLKRIGKEYVCESAYRAHETGLLQPIWPYDPGVPIADLRLLGGWTLKIGDPEDVDEARLLFTPDPLSPAMVDRYRDIRRYRDRLQKFDLRTLANSCGLFEDVIPASSIDSTVAEFLAKGKAGKDLLENQAFPPFRNALFPGEPLKPMGSIYQNALANLIAGGGVALVLDDPIGIVQELNAWRNDAIEINLPWLKAVDEQGLSNERKYVVAQALDDVKAAMQAGYVEKAVDKAAARLKSARYAHIRNTARFGTSFENQEEQTARYDPQQVRAQAETEKALVFKPYEDLLDWEAKTAIQSDFAARDLKAQEEMDTRAVDHLAWLDSDQFEHALDVYDRKQPVWGQAFATQIALCVLGMNGCSRGVTQLFSWWADTDIATRNLVWRAMTFNQTDLEEQTRIAFANASTLQGLTAENLIAALDTTSTWFEKVADLFTKADAATAAAITAGTYRWFDPRRLRLVLPLLSSFHQYLFKLLPNNAVDRHLLAPMLGFIHAGLGRATTSLRMRDLAATGQTANRNRVAGQINSHIDRVRRALTAEFQSGGGGQFYQIRGGVIMAMIEGVVLAIKASKRNDGEKEQLEYKAALLITSAAGVELAAISIQSVAARYAPAGVVGRGAAIALGGLRLVGGSLATAGGVTLALVDYGDGNEYFVKGHRALGSAYLARAAVSTGVAGLSAAISISYSGPLLRFLVGANSHSGFILAIEGLASSRLIPIILRLIGIGTVITAGLSIAIIAISPDEMEAWCWHSCLKAWKQENLLKPFKDQETELKTLYKALQGVN